MQKTTPKNKGYSLIEVLVAIAILMMSIVGPLTIAAKSIQTAQYAKQQTTAFFLAQEAISALEAVHHRRTLMVLGGTGSDSWFDFRSGGGSALQTCFASAGCDIVRTTTPSLNTITACNAGVSNPCTLRLADPAIHTTDAILYSHVTSGTTITPYTRTVTLTPMANTDEVLVTVVVQWDTKLVGSLTQNVTLRTSFFNTYKNF